MVTTYATLGADFSKNAKTCSGLPNPAVHPLGAIAWHRLVLDESERAGGRGGTSGLRGTLPSALLCVGCRAKHVLSRAAPVPCHAPPPPPAGHTVKNPSVGHSKACTALVSDRRWLCTGTPVNTDITDLFGQFCVLG